MKKLFTNVKKVSELQLFLTVLFVASLLISNIITAKQIQLPFGITMTSAIFIFPVTYILSDLFSEVYGYRWSRITCYLGFAMNLFMVGIFSLAIATPAPVYWENQEAFQTVLGNTPRTLFASLLAFVLGDLVNDRVFRFMKSKHLNSQEGFKARALVSSICGEFADSLIFVPLAFTGTMPFKVMITMIIIQPLLKICYEIIILPFTSLLVKKVIKIENKAVNKKTVLK